MTYASNPPHDYLTQDLANGKVRILALEEVVDAESNDDYENLRAVTSLDWALGLDLCYTMKDLTDEIATVAAQLEDGLTPKDRAARRPSAAARVRAARHLASPGQEAPVLRELIALSGHTPAAVATAVLAELDRLGMDGISVTASVRAADSATEQSSEAQAPISVI
ncbi:hypothetical protein ACI78Q_00345 [Geodermatophilus sp. SYSU D00705]